MGIPLAAISTTASRWRCAPMVAAARGLAGDNRGGASKGGCSFLFSRGLENRPENRACEGPGAADSRRSWAQAGKGISRNVLSSSFLCPAHQEAGCRCENTENPRKFRGKKIPHFPSYNFPGIHIFKYTNHDFFQQKNKTCIMHHMFLKYPDDFTLVKDAEKNCMA